MVQIFVRVNGSKATPMDVNLTDDKVEDVIRRVQNDEDVYVTMHGRVLKRGEKLKSCEVADGCTIQVTSRLRGGGKHKDKRSKAEKNQAASTRTPEQKFAEEAKSVKGPATQECDRDTAVRMIEENEETRKGMIRMMEENEDNRKMIESMSEGSDVDMEQMLQNYRTAGRDVLGWDQEQVETLERGLRWAIEARRKGRCENKRQQEQQEQRRQAEQGRNTEQEQSKQGKQVCFGEEQQLGKTGAENAGELEVMGGTTEVRIGRGSTGLVPGEDESRGLNETSSKGKGKGNGGKGEHEGKGGGFGHNGKQQEMREREEERVRMAPNMGAGGSHPQATSDPGERDDGREENPRDEMGRLRGRRGKGERPRERERDEARDKRGGEKARARARGTAGSGRGGERAGGAGRRKWKSARGA